MAMPTPTTQSSSSPSALLLRDVMTPDPAFVSPDETIQRAAQLMDELNVGALPVCGDGRRLAGIVTDRDITVRCTPRARPPAKPGWKRPCPPGRNGARRTTTSTPRGK
jgi:CBS-domain-containing membrane protein